MDKKQAQTKRLLTKAINALNLTKAIKESSNETTTRDFLIHPFFHALGFQKMYDYTHEYVADITGKKRMKVDMAITLGKGSPQILVECKKAGTTLSDRHFRQLNEYIHYTPSSKIGILTDGICYRFYVRPKDSSTGLDTIPFLEFDLTNPSSIDFDKLSLFYRPSIEINKILDEGEDELFLRRFDEALFQVFQTKTEGFVKDICQKMGSKRVTGKQKDQVRDLINAEAIKSAAESLWQSEVDSKSTGIITTAEELEAFYIIKTFLATSSKIKNCEESRIVPKDRKGAFTIVVDNNQRKKIAELKLTPTRKQLIIEEVIYDLDSISAVALSKYKSLLVTSALKHLK